MEAVLATGSITARRTAYGRAGLVLAIVVGLDQLTKHLVDASIEPGQVVKVVPGVELVHWRNTGIAFSALSGGGVVVYALTALAVAALVWNLSIRAARPWLWLPTGMLLGGAIGNVIDRVRSGAVTDFIKLPHWPAFNVADTSITIGVVLFVIVLEFGKRRSSSGS